MRSFSIAVALLVVLVLSADCWADFPVTEFFAIESAKLAKLAPTDADLDLLTTGKLAEISVVHGSYWNGTAMRFLTPTFRIDARFDGNADIRGTTQSIVPASERGPGVVYWEGGQSHGVAISTERNEIVYWTERE
jgi:hypothetical protein